MSGEKEKRKHGGDTVFSESQKKAREDGTAVTDEEVEEFCAILRQINTAVKYFKSGGDNVAALEKEIMEEVKGATLSGKAEDVVVNLTLDLNVPPHPQP